jgi:uncharacterized protein YjbI with pentapeptide repeats
MEFRSIDFTATTAVPDLGDDHIFRFCTFEQLDEDKIATAVDATFLGCRFKNIDFYWTLFNNVLFHDCEFKDCTFRGVSFAGCRFVDCSFESCVCTQDNLGGSCSFERSRWYGCTHNDCVGWKGVVWH